MITLRLIGVIVIAVLTTLVIQPVQAVTWTCYESSDSYWTMEQPEGYWPTWDDCEAWRYGPPEEQTSDVESEPSASETPLPDATEPSEPATDEPSMPTEEPSSEPTQEEQSPEPTSTPTPSSNEQPVPQPTADTPVTTESPEEPQSPKPQPSQSTPQTEPTPQLPVEPLVEETVNNLIEPVVESPKSPETFSNAFVDGILSISLPASVLQVSEAVGQAIQALADSLPESITNLGSDLSPENRKEAQQVVLAAIILPQLAASIARRI
jgi:hypothetical protein